MPRQRPRRRRSGAGAAPTAQPPADAHPQQEAPRRSIAGVTVPSLAVALAFSLGLWLGGMLSITEAGSAIALLGGAVGAGLFGARLFRNRLYQRRLERRRGR